MLIKIVTVVLLILFYYLSNTFDLSAHIFHNNASSKYVFEQFQVYCIFLLFSAFSEMGLLRVSQGLFEVLREQGIRCILNCSMLFDEPARMVVDG